MFFLYVSILIYLLSKIVKTVKTFVSNGKKVTNLFNELTSRLSYKSEPFNFLPSTACHTIKQTLGKLTELKPNTTLVELAIKHAHVPHFSITVFFKSKQRFKVCRIEFAMGNLLKSFDDTLLRKTAFNINKNERKYEQVILCHRLTDICPSRIWSCFHV